MPDIASVLKDHSEKNNSAPYKRPLTVMVVLIDTASTQDGSPLRFSIADKTTATRASCFSDKLKAKIVEGSGILISNYTIFRSTIILRDNAQVGKCSTKKMDIAPEIITRARELIQPPSLPTSPIKDIQAMQPHVPVSIVGKVTNVQDQTTVLIEGRDTPIRNITMKDSTSSVRVALWRHHSATEVKEGDTIEIMNAKTSIFNRELVVNTSFATTVKTSPPIEEKVTMTFVAIEEEDELDVVLMSVPTNSEEAISFKVPKILLFQAFQHILTVEDFIEILPVSVSVTMFGTKVVKLEAATNMSENLHEEDKTSCKESGEN